MVTKKAPSLDGSGKIWDKYFATTIARTATTIASTARGTANGVAPTDAASHIPIANMVTSGIICVHWNGVAWPASRPTPRTDITVFIDAPVGTAKPVWMIANIDRIEYF